MINQQKDGQKYAIPHDLKYRYNLVIHSQLDSNNPLLAIRLFVQQFTQTKNTENIKVVPVLYVGIQRWPADSRQKRPVLRHRFPCDDVINLYLTLLKMCAFHTYVWYDIIYTHTHIYIYIYVSVSLDQTDNWNKNVYRWCEGNRDKMGW